MGVETSPVPGISNCKQFPSVTGYTCGLDGSTKHRCKSASQKHFFFAVPGVFFAQTVSLPLHITIPATYRCYFDPLIEVIRAVVSMTKATSERRSGPPELFDRSTPVWSLRIDQLNFFRHGIFCILSRNETTIARYWQPCRLYIDLCLVRRGHLSSVYKQDRALLFSGVPSTPAERRKQHCRCYTHTPVSRWVRSTAYVLSAFIAPVSNERKQSSTS